MWRCRRVTRPFNNGDALTAVLQMLRPVSAFREALVELQGGNVAGHDAVSLRAMFRGECPQSAFSRRVSQHVVINSTTTTVLWMTTPYEGVVQLKVLRVQLIFSNSNATTAKFGTDTPQVDDRSCLDPSVVLEKLFSELTRCTERVNVSVMVGLRSHEWSHSTVGADMQRGTQ